MNKSNYSTSMRNCVLVTNFNIRGWARTNVLVRLVFGEKKKKWLPGAQAGLDEIVRFMFSGAA